MGRTRRCKGAGSSQIHGGLVGVSAYLREENQRINRGDQARGAESLEDYTRGWESVQVWEGGEWTHQKMET